MRAHPPWPLPRHSDACVVCSDRFQPSLQLGLGYLCNDSGTITLFNWIKACTQFLLCFQQAFALGCYSMCHVDHPKFLQWLPLWCNSKVSRITSVCDVLVVVLSATTLPSLSVLNSAVTDVTHNWYSCDPGHSSSRCWAFQTYSTHSNGGESKLSSCMHNRYPSVREDTHSIHLLPERVHDVWPLAGQLQLLNTNKTVRITHNINISPVSCKQ